MNIDQLIATARTLRGIPFDQVHPPFSSLGELLDRRAQESPDARWIVFYDDDGSRRELTYGAFRERVARLAGWLAAQGVEAGDRVVTIAYNHLDTVVQYFAAWWIGATVVPVNAAEDDARISYILENSRARVAFVRAAYVGRVLALDLPPALSTLVRVGGDGELPEGWLSYDELIDGEQEWEAIAPLSDQMNRECLIVYTSGTTGHPKGVLLAQGNLLVDAEAIATWHGVRPEHPMMCVLPIHHVNGTVVTLVTPMVAGSSVVLNRKFQSSTFFERIAAERVEIVSVVPTLLAFLVQADVDTTALDLGSFRHLICGAGPLTCELAARFEERYGFPIVHGYGLSETTCYSCFLPASLPMDEHRRWMYEHGFPSIGVAIPPNEMAIHDAEGDEVADGERGEIVIRGHTVMLGYYANDEANASAFAHGWFRSGDEGFALTAKGGERYFFITGRLKELIIRGGVNISPLEIDEVLNGHPGVTAAIAVGFENSWYGEEVGALVRSDSTVGAEELLAYCRDHLPAYKAPKVVIFAEEIPVTSTGKYQRNKVRHLFAEHRERQFAEGRRRSTSGEQV